MICQEYNKGRIHVMCEIHTSQNLVANYFKSSITNIKMQFESLISTCCFILNLQPNAQNLNSITSKDNSVCFHVISSYKDKHLIPNYQPKNRKSSQWVSMVHYRLVQNKWSFWTPPDVIYPYRASISLNIMDSNLFKNIFIQHKHLWHETFLLRGETNAVP